MYYVEYEIFLKYITWHENIRHESIRQKYRPVFKSIFGLFFYTKTMKFSVDSVVNILGANTPLAFYSSALSALSVKNS